jgi:hypothetical protein
MTTINVTAGHIARGDRGTPWDCAVALALKAAFPAAGLISVGVTDFDIDDTVYDVPFPPEASAFIDAFDSGAEVEPFSFNVDYPAAVTA